MFCSLSILVAFAWLGASETIREIAPAVAYTLISLSLIIVFLGFLALLFIGGETVWTRRSHLMADRRITNAKALEAEAKAIEAKVMIITAPKDHQLVVRDPDNKSDYRQLHLNPMPVVNGHWEQPTAQQLELYRNYRGLPASNQIEEMVIEQSEVAPLLPAIKKCENLLIVGGKGSGKTTLLQWIEAERLQDGQTIALDSHAVPGQWIGQYVGAGRKYAMIKNAMISLVDRMDERHKERTRGRKIFKPIHTFIDEFTLLPGYLKQADYEVQNYSFPMLTEGRKVEMTCLWGTHSDRAKPLGFEGIADLKECFDAIVYLKKVQDEYYALVDFGEGKQSTRFTLPGPFIRPAINNASQQVINNRPRPNEIEMKVFQAWREMMKSDRQSWNQLHHLVSGTTTNSNPRQREKYKSLFEKYGVDPKLS